MNGTHSKPKEFPPFIAAYGIVLQQAQTIAHLGFVNNVQDAHIKGMGDVIKDKEKYRNSYIAAIARLIGDVEESVRGLQRVSSRNLIYLFGIVSVIAIVSYLQLHPEFIPLAFVFLNQYGLELIATGAILMGLILFLVLRRRRIR